MLGTGEGLLHGTPLEPHTGADRARVRNLPVEVRQDRPEPDRSGQVRCQLKVRSGDRSDMACPVQRRYGPRPPALPLRIFGEPAVGGALLLLRMDEVVVGDRTPNLIRLPV